MISDVRKTPFPWFGGKTDAASVVWAALGDVPHYVEPFFGGGAVLLRRPHPCNRTYYSETVNDADGLLVNFWRAVQRSPQAVAEAASWPVAEADLMARHLSLLRWKEERDLERLMADPAYHDPVVAGWWVWGLCCWIGGGWCDGSGPWVVGKDGRIVRRGKVSEPGVSRRRPHATTNGRGVNNAGTREPGVCRQLPHVSDNGQGVNHPGTREPGVSRRLPHVSDNGRGVNRPHLREPGVGEYHPMTMPELLRWFEFLSARLRHVRIINGDWRRVVKPGLVLSLPVRQGHGPAGVFLDPPYSQDVRRADLYATDSAGITEACRAWCLKHGKDRRYRIVLAGFAGEGHEELEQHGWRVVEWFRAGHLKGGMGNLAHRDDGDDGPAHQQHLERLWLSPHCQREPEQAGLFDHEEEEAA